jgi:hypothetical protein
MSQMDNSQLRASSIEGEYYLGDLPGRLQYSKKMSDILNLRELPTDSNTCGYELVTGELDEYLPKMLPHTKKADPKKWKILILVKREFDTQVWLKAAIQNLETSDIALMTSTNSAYNIVSKGNRAILSNDKNWFVGHYRMAAPMVFWRNLIL